MAIERFEDIEAWQLARKLSSNVDSACQGKAFSRDFSLRDQIQRSSGSVMDNIAEGFDGGSNAEFARFLGYSQRSCREVQSQLYRALDREHIGKGEFEQLYELADHVQRKVGAFIKYLRGAGADRHPRQRRTKNEEQRTKNEERATR